MRVGDYNRRSGAVGSYGRVIVVFIIFCICCIGTVSAYGYYGPPSSSDHASSGHDTFSDGGSSYFYSGDIPSFGEWIRQITNPTNSISGMEVRGGENGLDGGIGIAVNTYSGSDREAMQQAIPGDSLRMFTDQYGDVYYLTSDGYLFKPSTGEWFDVQDAPAATEGTQTDSGIDNLGPISRPTGLWHVDDGTPPQDSSTTDSQTDSGIDNLGPMSRPTGLWHVDDGTPSQDSSTTDSQTDSGTSDQPAPGSQSQQGDNAGSIPSSRMFNFPDDQFTEVVRTDQSNTPPESGTSDTQPPDNTYTWVDELWDPSLEYLPDNQQADQTDMPSLPQQVDHTFDWVNDLTIPTGTGDQQLSSNEIREIRDVLKVVVPVVWGMANQNPGISQEERQAEMEKEVQDFLNNNEPDEIRAQLKEWKSLLNKIMSNNGGAS